VRGGCEESAGHSDRAPDGGAGLLDETDGSEGGEALAGARLAHEADALTVQHLE